MRDYAELDGQIRLLLRDEGPLTTTEVAERLGVDRDLAYRRLRRLIDHHGAGYRLSMTLEDSGRRHSFFPVTGEPMTKGNYTRIKTAIARMKTIAREVGATEGVPLTAKQRGTLLTRYRLELVRLKKESPRQTHPKIDDWERRMTAAMAGPGFLGLGLPSFPVMVGVWDSEWETL